MQVQKTIITTEKSSSHQTNATYEGSGDGSDVESSGDSDEGSGDDSEEGSGGTEIYYDMTTQPNMNDTGGNELEINNSTNSEEVDYTYHGPHASDSEEPDVDYT